MRKLTAVVAATLVVLALAGCTSSDADEEGVSAETRAETEAGTDAPAAAPGPGSDPSSGPGSDGEPSAQDDGSSGTGSPSGDAGADAGDLSDFLGEDAGDCLEVTLAYGSVYLSALGLGSEQELAELDRQLDEIRDKVPADVQDDLQTIADGLSEADGLVEVGEFFESEEYRRADENVTAYLEETCGDVAN
jgi:hypothetical protein